jgi:hypothetical protein
MILDFSFATLHHPILLSAQVNNYNPSRAREHMPTIADRAIDH